MPYLLIYSNIIIMFIIIFIITTTTTIIDKVCYSLGWLRAHYVKQVSLKLTELQLHLPLPLKKGMYVALCPAS